MSELGIISEHIQFANFATSIGMAAFCPFLYRLVVIRRQKMMCLAGFSLMYIFSYICAKTDSVFLLALCSIFMGFLRMVLMMVNLFTLIKYAGHIEAYDKITPGNEPTTDEGWDMLDIERSGTQPAIYLFFMVLGHLTLPTSPARLEYMNGSTYTTLWWGYYYFASSSPSLCLIINILHLAVSHQFPKQFGNASIFCITPASHYLRAYQRQSARLVRWPNQRLMGCSVCAFIIAGKILGRVYPAQPLLSVTGCIQTAYHPYGFPILFSVNGTGI